MLSDEELDLALRTHAAQPHEPPQHLRRDLIAATEPQVRPRWMPRFAFASAAVLALGLAYWVPHHPTAVASDEASLVLADNDEGEMADDTALYEIASIADDGAPR